MSIKGGLKINLDKRNLGMSQAIKITKPFLLHVCIEIPARIKILNIIVMEHSLWMPTDIFFEYFLGGFSIIRPYQAVYLNYTKLIGNLVFD